MLQEIAHYVNYWLAGFVILVGIFGILERPNLMRKLMAMNIMQVGVIYFYISIAAKEGAAPPILLGTSSAEADTFVNPLPHALMLTAIVVGVATTGVALALLVRVAKRFGTLDERVLLKRMRK